MAFIPIILSSNNSFQSEAAVKYFLIQAVGSATLIAAALLFIYLDTLPGVLLISSLLLKVGAAPLHFWLPVTIRCISWPQCLILITIQKVAPLALISYTVTPQTTGILITASIIRAVVGGIAGLNQVLIRNILAFSSINHLSWLLVGVFLDSALWINYLLIYSILSACLVVILSSCQIFHVQQLFNINTTNLNKITLFLRLLSLGGLPPLLGFIPKIIIALRLSFKMLNLWLIILVMSSLITLFYYIRLALTGLTLTQPKIKMYPEIPADISRIAISLINLCPIILPVLALTNF